MTLRDQRSVIDNVVELRPRQFSASGEMIDGIGVVAVRGALTMDALPLCRRAIDGVLRRRPKTIVLDVHLIDDASGAVPVLGLVRRYLARHGARLVIAGPAQRVEQVLRDGHVLDLYTITPSLASALLLASGPPALTGATAIRSRQGTVTER